MARKQQARFDYEAITARIAEACERAGKPAKQVYEAAGLTGDRWYRKMTGRGSTFTLDELGRVADALEAPPAWPFVDWDRAEVLRRSEGA